MSTFRAIDNLNHEDGLLACSPNTREMQEPGEDLIFITDQDGNALYLAYDEATALHEWLGRALGIAAK